MQPKLSKPKTIKEKLLKYPVRKWSWKHREKYYAWVKETYGDVPNPESYVDGYRAWRQIVWSMPIYKEPTTLITSAGMVAMAQKILNESFKEVYENHNNRL
jgi:hypothetical protein